MAITGGFGTTLDIERGTSRKWVKRWADNGHPLTQELLNSIMREPGENHSASAPVLPACPQCGERYCGDGAQLCAECAAPNAQAQARPEAPKAL